jgi:hypothetical protein
VKLSKLICPMMLAALALAGCNDQSANSAGLQSGLGHADAPETIGNATLSWEAPTTDTNGGALTNLAGYRIYYGLNRSDLSETISVNTTGLQTYVVENLGTGTWYFAVRAVTNTGVESALSDVVSKTIG